jgi:hypothetical protein
MISASWCRRLMKSAARRASNRLVTRRVAAVRCAAAAQGAWCVEAAQRVLAAHRIRAAARLPECARAGEAPAHCTFAFA